MKYITKIRNVIVIGLMLFCVQTLNAQNIFQAGVFMDNGRKEMGTHNNEKALDQFHKALEIYEEANHKEGQKEALYMIGLVYAAKYGNWLEAEKYWLKTLDIAKEIDDKEKIARLQGNLGIVYDKQSRYQLAEQYHKKSLKYYRETGNTTRVLITLKNLGMLKLNQSNYYFAEKYFNEALKLAKETENNAEIYKIGYNIGLLNYKKGNYGKAFTMYKKAMADIAGSDTNDEAEISNNIGTIYNAYDDTASAKKYYFKALKISEQTGNQDIKSRVLNNLGNLYFAHEEYDKALNYHKDAILLFDSIGNRQGLAIAFTNLGLDFQATGEYKQAKDNFEKSMETKEDIGYLWGVSYQNYCFGDLYAEQEMYEKAQLYYDTGLKQAEQIDAVELIYKFAAAKAGAYAKAGNPAKAEEQYRKSIDIIENIRADIVVENDRINFMEYIMPVYKDLIEIKIAQNEYKEAYEFYERMKVRNLLDIINGADIVFEDYMSEEEIERQAELESENRRVNNEIKFFCSQTANSKRSISTLVERQSKVREELRGFNEKLLINHPELVAKITTGTTINFNSVSRILTDPDEVVLAYLVKDNKSFCFVLKKNNDNKVDIDVITIDITKEQLKQLSNNMLNDWQIQSTELLYNHLIAPVKDLLGNAGQLCIIPDSYLHSIPFQSLQNPDNKRFLIEDYAIYYSYSLSMLKQLKEQVKSKDDEIIAFGNPYFGETGVATPKQVFASLPKSEQEVKNIAGIYGDKSIVLLQKEASETNFKQNAKKYDIVHIATHGLLDEVNPMFSSLLLASDSIQDGFLSAREIITLDMNSSLVILSACETAKGKISEGEGMIGLSRAFFGATVPTVIASLWQVDDESTRLLMEDFHRNLKKMNYAEALQKAQLNLLRNTDYKDPFFWAPFIILGSAK